MDCKFNGLIRNWTLIGNWELKLGISTYCINKLGFFTRRLKTKFWHSKSSMLWLISLLAQICFNQDYRYSKGDGNMGCRFNIQYEDPLVRNKSNWPTICQYFSYFNISSTQIVWAMQRGFNDTHQYKFPPLSNCLFSFLHTSLISWFGSNLVKPMVLHIYGINSCITF